MNINLGGGRSITVNRLTFGVTELTPVEDGPYLGAAEDCVNRVARQLNYVTSSFGNFVIQELKSRGFVIMKVTEKKTPEVA